MYRNILGSKILIFFWKINGVIIAYLQQTTDLTRLKYSFLKAHLQQTVLTRLKYSFLFSSCQLWRQNLDKHMVLRQQ